MVSVMCCLQSIGTRNLALGDTTTGNLVPLDHFAAVWEENAEPVAIRSFTY